MNVQYPTYQISNINNFYVPSCKSQAQPSPENLMNLTDRPGVKPYREGRDSSSQLSSCLHVAGVAGECGQAGDTCLHLSPPGTTPQLQAVSDGEMDQIEESHNFEKIPLS